MAKKKDLDDENINEENQGGDINEADDSFGLPDVDYQPLEEEVQEEPAEEPQAEPESDPEPETTVEEEQETYAYTADSSDTYGETSDEEESDEPAYVPGSYTPPKQESNKAGIVIGVIIVLLLAVLAIWYWRFHLPAQEAAEKARIEQERQDKIEADKKAAAAQAEADRIAQEEAAAAAAEEEAAAAEPEAGTIETISARTGRYYVVVASAIDGDLAMDYAKELSEAGESVKIIEPYGKVKFYRVAVQGLDSWDEAQNKANELKADYGDGVWVIKY